MKTSFLVFSTLCLLLVEQSSAEMINSIATHTSDCIFCGMVEGVGYLTVKVIIGGNPSIIVTFL